MGIFNFFGGNSPAEKALKFKGRLTQKYGEPANRQKAIAELADMKTPETVPVLMLRFTFSVDPQTTDAEEKEAVFRAVSSLGTAAVPNVANFLQRNDGYSSWAVKILEEVLPASEVIAVVTEELSRLGAGYTRDPEKKEVLLNFLEGKQDQRIGPAVLPLVHDMSDDVKMAALKLVGQVKLDAAVGEIIKLLLSSDTARRVQTACWQSLADSGLSIEAHRDVIASKLVEPFVIEKSGFVTRRGPSYDLGT
jgi:hypothetical protein